MNPGKEFIDAQAILRSCGLGLFDLRVDSLISLYKDRWLLCSVAHTAFIGSYWVLFLLYLSIFCKPFGLSLLSNSIHFYLIMFIYLYYELFVSNLFFSI
jgi:hypothetical protein